MPTAFFSFRPQASPSQSNLPSTLQEQLMDNTLAWTLVCWKVLFSSTIQQYCESNKVFIIIAQPRKLMWLSFLPQQPSHLPVALTKLSTWLFLAFPAHQGLKSQTISAYLSPFWHLHVSARLRPNQGLEQPYLHVQYVLRNIARSRPEAAHQRLTITAPIMHQLQVACPKHPRIQPILAAWTLKAKL